MLRTGANGYVLKDTDPRELEMAITHIYKYGFYHSELVTGRMLHILQHSEEKDATELNANEAQFLRLCCSELTYKEIATKMGLSPRTIDGYREILFKRFNTTSRTGLVIYAIRAGICPLY